MARNIPKNIRLDGKDPKARLVAQFLDGLDRKQGKFLVAIVYKFLVSNGVTKSEDITPEIIKYLYGKAFYESDQNDMLLNLLSMQKMMGGMPMNNAQERSEVHTETTVTKKEPEPIPEKKESKEFFIDETDYDDGFGPDDLEDFLP